MDADAATWARAPRPKACKLARNRRLQRLVAGKLGLKWSPEQISVWLQRTFPNDESLQVSHETIYRSLFIQTRGVLKKELMKHLRSRRVMRHGKNFTTKGKPRGQIIDAVSIRERPAQIEDRSIPGHWEGDLIAGSRNTHVATLVERHSRFTMLVKLNGKDTQTVVSALIRQVKRLPGELRRSLTWDRGSEMAQHKQITVATDLQIYFCDPQSPWQRGTNENTNRLLRQYFPKCTDLSVHSQAELNAVARKLNQRPRKTLGDDHREARTGYETQVHSRNGPRQSLRGKVVREQGIGRRAAGRLADTNTDTRHKQLPEIAGQSAERCHQAPDVNAGCHYVFATVAVCQFCDRQAEYRVEERECKSHDQAYFHVAQSEIGFDGFHEERENSAIEKVHHHGERQDGYAVPRLCCRWIFFCIGIGDLLCRSYVHVNLQGRYQCWPDCNHNRANRELRND
jgi:IS30 family transposase